MLAIIGIIFIVITIVLNRGFGKLIKSKSLKYFNKSQDIEGSLKYLKGFNKFYFFTYTITLLMLIFGFYLILREFLDSNKSLIIIASVLAFTVYLMIAFMISKIVLQAEMEIKGSNRNKKQERMMLKFIGLYFLMYLLFAITFINFIYIATDIYFVRFEFGFYLKIGLVLLGYVIAFILSINEKKVFNMIFMGKPFLNDDIESFVHKIDPNVKLFYFESNDLKMANAFTIDGKQKSIYISDYLFNNITSNELKAVVAHELGHLKMKHLSKRSRLILLGYLLGFIIQYQTLLIFAGNTLLSTLLIFIFLIVYYIILKNKFYQKHEQMADAFMIEVGIAKDDAIQLLEKLSSLNYLPRNGAKLDHVLKTHPSIENRINHLKSL